MAFFPVPQRTRRVLQSADRYDNRRELARERDEEIGYTRVDFHVLCRSRVVHAGGIDKLTKKKDSVGMHEHSHRRLQVAFGKSGISDGN